jgi:hypothetical protein
VVSAESVSLAIKSKFEAMLYEDHQNLAEWGIFLVLVHYPLSISVYVQSRALFAKPMILIVASHISENLRRC